MSDMRHDERLSELYGQALGEQILGTSIVESIRQRARDFGATIMPSRPVTTGTQLTMEVLQNSFAMMNLDIHLDNARWSYSSFSHSSLEDWDIFKDGRLVIAHVTQPGFNGFQNQDVITIRTSRFIDAHVLYDHSFNLCDDIHRAAHGLIPDRPPLYLNRIKSLRYKGNRYQLQSLSPETLRDDLKSRYPKGKVVLYYRYV